MSTSRKIFIGRVFIPGLAATSLYALMRDSALHWGFEDTTLTTPSFDSIIGSNCICTPDGAVRIGSDNTTSTVVGIAKAAAASFSLSDFGPDFGIIDPTAIWFYSLNNSGTGMDVTFTAR